MQLYPLKLFPDKSDFNFMNFRKVSFSLSIILCIVSFIYIGLYKFNFGIDFTGGIAIELKVDQDPDLASMREVLNNLNLGEVVLQNFGGPQDLIIKFGSTHISNLTKDVALIKTAIADSFPYQCDYRKVDLVGPQVGRALIESGSIAICLAFVAIMIYVWIRFEWYFGIGVLIALLHDVIIACGFMSISRLDFSLSSIAAILTIIGYSVNDSVVIYDRVRENIRKFSNKNLIEIINLSINETLSRTILTVLTTLIANLALIIFGGEALRSFSVLVFFGIFIGTYSSIFISAPILIFLTKGRFKTLKSK
ncbi:MAG: protein translocase subunit SecF [Rickettsiaceae bacterium]